MEKALAPRQRKQMGKTKTKKKKKNRENGCKKDGLPHMGNKIAEL